MKTRNNREERERHRRHSARALPAYLLFVTVSGVLVYLFPGWWSWLLLAVTAFTLVGDLLNVAFSRRQESVAPRRSE